MKKTAWIVLGGFLALLLSGPFLTASGGEDFKSFKKAVKENTAFEPGKDAKWLKILITDTRTDEVQVKITLPIALVEIALKCVDDAEIELDDVDCDLDLKALWKELKKAGPMTMIEIRDGDELVKVWLE